LLRRLLRLPLYAIEQLCLEGLLEPETHFLVWIARSQMNVRQASVDRLLADLHATAAAGPPPAEARKVAYAANRVGGGPKPWGAIVAAMLRGDFPFWMPAGHGNFRNIAVRPSDLARFTRAPVELRKLPGGICQEFCQQDAAEILNIKTSDLARLSGELGLFPKKSGRRQATPLGGLLSVAGRIAWPGEIAWQMGVKPQKVRYLMREEGVAPISTGWDRLQLIGLGLLPF